MSFSSNFVCFSITSSKNMTPKKRHARLAFLRSHLSRWCYITGITVSHYACVCVCFSQLICLKTRVLRQLHAISLLHEEIQSCDYSLSLDMLLRQPHRSLVDKDWALTLLICRLSSEMLLRQPHRSLVDKDWALTLLICRLSSEMLLRQHAP